MFNCLIESSKGMQYTLGHQTGTYYSLSRVPWGTVGQFRHYLCEIVNIPENMVPTPKEMGSEINLGCCS